MEIDNLIVANSNGVLPYIGEDTVSGLLNMGLRKLSV